MVLSPAVHTLDFVCSGCSLHRSTGLILPQLANVSEPTPFLSFKSIVIVVGPVELWATRKRRPSAAANPQGF